MGTPLLVLGAAISGFALFAQADVPGSAIGASGIAIGGGFAIWYGYYMTTRVQPEQQKRHDEQVSGLTKQHAETLKDQAKAFAEAVREQAGAFAKVAERQIQSFDMNVTNALQQIDKVSAIQREDLRRWWDESRDERRLDREARHEFFNKIAPMLAYIEDQTCETGKP